MHFLDKPIDKMTSASSLFLLFLYFRKSILEIFSELDENLREIFMRNKTPPHQKATWGATQGPGTAPCRGPTRRREWDLMEYWKELGGAPSKGGIARKFAENFYST